MKESQIFDVIVAGGGPGGALAAKRCAENGLNTLIIERRQLPRDKVCSGLVMGKWAVQSIEQEFGSIPPSAFADPPLLSGHRFYVGTAKPEEMKWPCSLSWRRELDFWMVQEAVKSGASLKDGVRVKRIESEKDGCRVVVQRKGKTKNLHARFVVGADGAVSQVRKSIFPELKVRYSSPMRECYQGALDLEKDIFHWFFPKNHPRPRFNVNHKDDVFMIEGSGLPVLQNEIGEILSAYGFDPASRPIRKDGCAIPILHEPLLSGQFRPALKNVLLVGDAGGLILPITHEGLGSALKSGILAAEAIVDSFDNVTAAASSYLKSLEPILEAIRKLCKVQDELNAVASGSADNLAQKLRDAYRETLIIQEPWETSH